MSFERYYILARSKNFARVSGSGRRTRRISPEEIADKHFRTVVVPRKIQSAFRAHVLRKRIRSAVMIQRAFRHHLYMPGGTGFVNAEMRFMMNCEEWRISNMKLKIQKEKSFQAFPYFWSQIRVSSWIHQIYRDLLSFWPEYIRYIAINLAVNVNSSDISRSIWLSTWIHQVYRDQFGCHREYIRYIAIDRAFDLNTSDISGSIWLSTWIHQIYRDQFFFHCEYIRYIVINSGFIVNTSGISRSIRVSSWIHQIYRDILSFHREYIRYNAINSGFIVNTSDISWSIQVSSWIHHIYRDQFGFHCEYIRYITINSGFSVNIRTTLKI